MKYILYPHIARYSNQMFIIFEQFVPFQQYNLIDNKKNFLDSKSVENLNCTPSKSDSIITNFSPEEMVEIFSLTTSSKILLDAWRSNILFVIKHFTKLI
jgi:hypothetical protein